MGTYIKTCKSEGVVMGEDGVVGVKEVSAERIEELKKEGEESKKAFFKKAERQNFIDAVASVRVSKKLLEYYRELAALRREKYEEAIKEGVESKENMLKLKKDVLESEDMVQSGEMALILAKEQLFYMGGRDNRLAFAKEVQTYYEEVEKQADKYITSLKRIGWNIYER